ncbi:hypothetical protein Tco_1096003 [Tanacetum coccineum]
MSFPTSIYSLGNIMDEVDIEDLTIEEYLKLTQENHAPRIVSLGIKEDRVKIQMKEEECNFTTDVSEHLNKPTSQDGLSHEADSKTYWCEPNNKLEGQTREKTLTEEQEDPGKCGETKTRAIIGAMINKLPEEWFSGVSKDMDDLEGIIDYIEPTLYDGFIDHNNEAYKRRRNKLLGMPYTEPPPIIKEEAEITKYNLGASEWKEDGCTKWASCNPHFDECDGGDNPRENDEYWERSNDNKRTDLGWENLSFDNWVKVAIGMNPEAKRQLSRPARLMIMW